MVRNFQGKHREFGNFAKTQGILFAQVVDYLILKIHDIAIFATKCSISSWTVKSMEKHMEFASLLHPRDSDVLYLRRGCHIQNGSDGSGRSDCITRDKQRAISWGMTTTWRFRSCHAYFSFILTTLI